MGDTAPALVAGPGALAHDLGKLSVLVGLSPPTPAELGCGTPGQHRSVEDPSRLAPAARRAAARPDAAWFPRTARPRRAAPRPGRDRSAPAHRTFSFFDRYEQTVVYATTVLPCRNGWDSRDY